MVLIHIARGLAAGVAAAALFAALPGAPTLAAGPAASAAGIYTGPKAQGSGQLIFQGGDFGGGVEHVPAVYLVYWDWLGADPRGEGPYLEHFLGGVGGSAWNATVTQYCDGIAAGASSCLDAGTAATNPSGLLKATWHDDTDAIPANFSDTDLGNEAVRAAAHFGLTSSAQLQDAQIVLATPSGRSEAGFGSAFCAWHWTFGASFGEVAFTNLPYIPDAGGVCGQGVVNSPGTLDGVSIVEGHELAETETDQYANGGWLDGGGYEIGDKCAWLTSGPGRMENITLTTGSFAVQGLWSNFTSSGGGGCLDAFNATHLHFQLEPSSVTAGALISVQVTELDDTGRAVSDSSTAVTLSLSSNPGGDSLGGTLTRTLSGGSASFSNLLLTRAATGYQLLAAAPGMMAAQTTPFDVVAGPPALLNTTVTVDSGAATVVPYQGSVTVRSVVTDAFGNAVVMPSVHIQVSDPLRRVIVDETMPASAGSATVHLSGLDTAVPGQYSVTTYTTAPAMTRGGSYTVAA
ncbi:MAG: hypothetical protein ACYDAY_03205 [Candidatus Dormibacteria bacterium]